MALKWSRTLQRASPGTPKAPGQGRHPREQMLLKRSSTILGGFDLESVQALWGSTLAHPLIFLFGSLMHPQGLKPRWSQDPCGGHREEGQVAE